MKKNNTKMTLGVIIGNRDFFPDKLVGECRADLLSVFDNANVKPVMLEETDTKLGGVETFQDRAARCAHQAGAYGQGTSGNYMGACLN